MNKKVLINRGLLFFIIISSSICMYISFFMRINMNHYALCNNRFLLLAAAALSESNKMRIPLTIFWGLLDISMLLCLIPLKKIYIIRKIASYVLRGACLYELIIVITSGFVFGSVLSLLMTIMLLCCLVYEFRPNKELIDWNVQKKYKNPDFIKTL